MPGARAGSNSEKERVLTQRQCLVIFLKEKHVWGPDCGLLKPRVRGFTHTRALNLHTCKEV